MHFPFSGRVSIQTNIDLLILSFRMISCQEKALEHMKLGLFDVLPTGSMDGLTAEDFRLLLNGVGDINVQTLISYTSFNDESGESPDRLVAIKRYEFIFYNISFLIH